MKKKSKSVDVSLDHPEGYSVPFTEIKRLVDSLDYASADRIAIVLLALTGCRPSELEVFTLDSIWKDWIMWQPGKRQVGTRKIQLPDWFLTELDVYTKKQHLPNRKLLPFTTDTFRRKFNRKIRPAVGGEWLKKRPRISHRFVKYEYVYQLKSFRHTYATKIFHEGAKVYGTELAVHLASKDMKHSSTYMTSRHYVSDVVQLQDELVRYQGESIGAIIRGADQTKLTAFGWSRPI